MGKGDSTEMQRKKNCGAEGHGKGGEAAYSKRAEKDDARRIKKETSRAGEPSHEGARLWGPSLKRKPPASPNVDIRESTSKKQTGPKQNKSKKGNNPISREKWVTAATH